MSLSKSDEVKASGGSNPPLSAKRKIDGRNFDFLIPNKKILIDYITGYKKLGNQYKINFCKERGYKLIEIPLSSQNDIASILNVCRHNISENVGEVDE